MPRVGCGMERVDVRPTFPYLLLVLSAALHSPFHLHSHSRGPSSPLSALLPQHSAVNGLRWCEEDTGGETLNCRTKARKDAPPQAVPSGRSGPASLAYECLRACTHTVAIVLSVSCRRPVLGSAGARKNHPVVAYGKRFLQPRQCRGSQPSLRVQVVGRHDDQKDMTT
jgi:hypothetical protein